MLEYTASYGGNMKFLKWLLNREKYDIGVIRFGDSILIPGRDYFKESKDIELLEEYKNIT